MFNVVSNYIADFESWEEQKKFFLFSSEDVQNLKKLYPTITEFGDEVVEELYDYLLRFEDIRAFLNNDSVIRRLKAAQKKYFLEMMSGEYGQSYYESRIKVGIVHKKLGVPPRLYMGAYSYYLQLMVPKIYRSSRFSTEQANQLYTALYKIISLDQQLAISGYVHEVEEIISRQSQEILEMSTPIIQIWEGIVAAPIIGTLDSQRAQQFMEQLLDKIVATRSLIAMIDITGVPQIDTATAQYLIDTISAVNLLGSKVIITGIRPAIAQTLVHLNISLKDITAMPSMGAGLKKALELLSAKNFEILE